MPQVGMMPQQNTLAQPLPQQPAPTQQLPPAQMPVGGFAQNGLSNLGQLPQPNLEQNALNGGGANNKQQISNFMSALNQTGAGANNTFMNSQNANVSPVQNLVNPNAIGMNNSNQTAIPTQQAVAGGMMGQTAMQGLGLGPTQQPIQQPIQQIPAVSGNALAQNAMSGVGMAPAFGPPQNNMQALPLAGGMQIDPGAVVSDENLKTDIKPADRELKGFMQSIKAHNYTYKDPNDGIGTFTSPMAQELEQTDLGKQAVIETPRGKMVDYARLGGVNLAAVAVVHREQQRLQDQLDDLRKQFQLKAK